MGKSEANRIAEQAKLCLSGVLSLLPLSSLIISSEVAK